MGVPGIGYWLVLVVLKTDVAQLPIWDILDIDPFDRKLSLPLLLCKNASHHMEVHVRCHLSNSTKMAATIHTEEQVNVSFSVLLAVGLVQSTVPVLSASPDTVLNGTVDVVFGVALDHKIPCIVQIEIELVRVILVFEV